MILQDEFLAKRIESTNEIPANVIILAGRPGRSGEVGAGRERGPTRSEQGTKGLHHPPTSPEPKPDRPAPPYLPKLNPAATCEKKKNLQSNSTDRFALARLPLTLEQVPVAAHRRSHDSRPRGTHIARSDGSPQRTKSFRSPCLSGPSLRAWQAQWTTFLAAGKEDRSGCQSNVLLRSSK